MNNMQTLPTKLIAKDRVIISPAKLVDLFKWRDNHKDQVRNFTSILPDVVIIVGGLAIHARKTTAPSTYTHRFTVYEGADIIVDLDWRQYDMTGHERIMNLPPYADKTDYVQSAISAYTSLMAYMTSEREQVERVQVKERRNKRKKRRKRKPTYVRRTEYRVTGDINTTEKRPYTKPEHAYKVRGHWREYKNGRRVWIDGYVKNRKAGDVAPKEYVL